MGLGLSRRLRLHELGRVWRRPVGWRHSAASVLVDELVGPVQAGAAHWAGHELGRALRLRRRPGDVARPAPERGRPGEWRRPRSRRW